MSLSIIILNYRSRRLTRQCLKALFAAPPRRSHEVIVVDNASGDGTAAMVRAEFPSVRVIEAPRNGGFAYGNNLGLAAATGDFLLVMNPDIIARPGAVDSLADFLEAHPDVGMVGPKLLRPDGSVDDSCYRFPTLGIPLYRRTPLGRTVRGRAAVASYLMSDFDRASTRDVDWLLGATVMVRRSAYAAVGPLDERFFLYFEDTDWCRRFWEAGWRVTYFPGTELIHFHERSSARRAWFLAPFLDQAARMHLASWVKYLLKYRGRSAPATSR